MAGLLAASVAVAGLTGCNKPKVEEAGPSGPPAPTAPNRNAMGPGTAGSAPGGMPATGEPQGQPAGQAGTPEDQGGTDGTEGSAPAADPKGATEETNRELVILASTGLERVAVALAKQYPGATVRVVGGAPYQLLRGIDRTGGDVLISEGFRGIEIGRAAGLVAPATETVATWLPLTVTVAGKQAESIRRLADLARPGIKLGVPDPKRSTAQAAAGRMLERAGMADQVKQRVLPSGAYSALRDGTVDAFVTWGRINGVGVPMPLPARFREHLPGVVAPLTTSKQPQAARALATWLASADTHRTWEDGGTSPTLAKGEPTVATELPVILRPPRRDAGCLAVDHRLLVIGGNAAGKRLGTFTWVDTTAMKTTNALAALGTGIEGPAVGWSADRREVIVAGGRTDRGYTDEILTFSPQSDTYTPEVARLPSPIAFAATAVSNARLTLFGGLGPGDKKSDRVMQIDLKTGKATLASARLPTPRAWLTALSEDPTGAAAGRTWLVGGESEIGGLSTLVSWDPIKDVVSRLPDRMPQAVRGMAHARHESGWLLLGGNTRKGPRDAVDRFDGPDSIKRESLRLPYPVAYGCAARLGDRIFLIGGLSRSRVEGRITRLPY